MINYDNCQYCGTALTEELRAKHSKDDKIWKCPNCEANVTAYSDEPTGFVGLPDIRRMRKYLYDKLYGCESYGLFLEVYMKSQYGKIKLTQLTDEELAEFYAFVDNLESLANSLFREEYTELFQRNYELFLKGQQIKNAQARFVFEKLPEETKQAILKKKAPTYTLQIQAIFNGEMPENKHASVPTASFPADEFSINLLNKAIRFSQLPEPRVVTPTSPNPPFTFLDLLCHP